MSTDHNLYAPPLTWGVWYTVQSHLGVHHCHISLHPASGNTKVYGRVRYYKGSGGGTQVDEMFTGSISFVTSNSVANIEVCLKGDPWGCGVRVTVD